MAPYLLKPKIGEHLNSITINITEAMVEHYSNEKNRSQQILKAMKEYLDTFSNNDFMGVDARKNITISKPNDALYSAIFLAVKSGLALSRSELFRQAIRWDMQRSTKINHEQLEEDAKNSVVRVPNGKDEVDTVYNVIGTA